MNQTTHHPAPSSALLPAAEARLLQALRELNLLDSAPDERFDRITRLAARLFGLPTALIGLVDAGRQWFKSQLGVNPAELPRAQSFCAQAVMQDDVMVVSDACADARFAPDPLAQGENPMRFYAGAPIALADGSRIGVLCILGHAPREFGSEDRALLRDLAAIVADVLRARLADHHAEQERARAANSLRRYGYFRAASHELRTPMASILGFSELLLRREFDAATGRELIDIIHRQATRLIGLVNQMLDLARIDAGGQAQLRPEPLDLPAIVARVEAAIEERAQATRLAVRAQPNLPQVAADPLRTEQALANIVANALAYSTPASPVEIDIDAQERGGRAGVAVTVRDLGIGMTPDQRSQVCEAFWRAGALPDVPGNGLGMTIVREIVELHGGLLEIASTPGAGSEVALWLPQAGPLTFEAGKVEPDADDHPGSTMA